MNAIDKLDAPAPSQMAPRYSPDLERIVMKGLARHRDYRYQTRGRDAAAISEAFAREQRLDVSARTVATFVRSVQAAARPRMRRWGPVRCSASSSARFDSAQTPRTPKVAVTDVTPRDRRPLGQARRLVRDARPAGGRRRRPGGLVRRAPSAALEAVPARAPRRRTPQPPTPPTPATDPPPPAPDAAAIEEPPTELVPPPMHPRREPRAPSRRPGAVARPTAPGDLPAVREVDGVAEVDVAPFAAHERHRPGDEAARGVQLVAGRRRACRAPPP